jgi:mitochondrial fission 1 protein
MGETKSSQKHVREELDRKLQLSSPSRELLEELAIACAKNPTSTDATFQYAFALSKSTERSELRYAVQILDGLIKDGYSHQVDCMYGAATALYLLGDYQHSRVSFEPLRYDDFMVTLWRHFYAAIST